MLVKCPNESRVSYGEFTNRTDRERFHTVETECRIGTPLKLIAKNALGAPRFSNVWLI